MDKPERFNDVLDECLKRLLLGNETIEQCLQRFPQHAAELKPLLETVLATRQATAVRPRPEFRKLARQRFNSAVREAGVKKARPPFRLAWHSGWAVAVSVILIAVLGGGGTVVAASGSMPDSPLYPVKRATEQVQLALTFSDLSKAELHARLADKRVSEIIYLSENDKPEKLDKVSDRLNEHLSEISLLAAVPGQVSTLAVAPLAERAIAPSESPAPVVPAPPVPTLAQQSDVPGRGPAVEKAAPAAQDKKASTGNASSVKENKNSGTENSSKDDRRTKLKTTVVSQSEVNIARLKAQLETAPESAKPALKKALALAEAEYKKTIDALK